MMDIEEFFVAGDLSFDFDRYRVHIWRKNSTGARLMRVVSWYPSDGNLFDSMPGRYGDKEAVSKEVFTKILKQYVNRPHWFMLKEGQNIGDFKD